MAPGPVSTGKSVSIQAALSLFGADNAKNHYMKCSKAFYLQWAAISSLLVVSPLPLVFIIYPHILFPIDLISDTIQ